jgi:isopentenyldiphosphate isomerase
MDKDLGYKYVEGFVSKLSQDDVLWLNAQLASALNVPPADWVNWHMIMDGECLSGGVIPPERIAQMAEVVPNMYRDHDLWRWDTRGESLQWRSTTLQQWLWMEHIHGQLDDWRFELQDWLPDPTFHTVQHIDDEPTVGLRIERSGFRHLGLRSRAVHVNGFTDEGQLVVGLRSALKRIDPGLYDNLMAGGMAAGESWKETFGREMHEETGLEASIWPHLSCAGTVHVGRVEGASWHSETLIICHVLLPMGVKPNNQDGEVERFATFDAQETLMRMRSGEFTRDAVLALALAVQQA